MSDWELIRRYAKEQSEPAFAELVHRHLAWVYSVALRHVRQPELAEEVAQSVFIILARKASSLRAGTILGGWLFRTTCFVASRALRAEERQKNREQAVSSMTLATNFPEEHGIAWERLAPHLDNAVAKLSEPDRLAILLRFYEKKPLQEVGDRLGISEEAAKKRVSRAVEKLKVFFNQRGITIGGAVLVTVLGQKTVEAAPPTLELGVLKVAVAGASASTALPALVHETLTAWKWAKVKMALGLAGGSLALILVLINTGGLFVRNRTSQRASVNALPQAQTLGTDQVLNVSPPQAVSAQVPQKFGALTGLVVDDLGQPVSGAKVWGGFSSQPFAEDITDQSGQFVIEKIAAPPFITVTAAGFAADQQEFDPTNITGTFVFHLNPIHPLDLRLVDESGQGVPGVRPFLANWWGRSGTLGQHLPQQTDTDGRLQWLSPPKGELELQFGKKDYCYSRTNKLFADGMEHVIVLHPALALTGSVADAETGAPVSSFRFTSGHAQPWVPSDPTPLWDLHSNPGTKGFYRTIIDEEQVPYLRIEADGYETAEIEIQLTNRVEAICDFQLTPLSVARSIRGTVLLPNGNPASGVEVALCTAKVGVMLSGTAFKQGAFGNIRAFQQDDYRRKTGAEGSFAFDPKPGAHTVVAVGAAGLGQVRCFDFSNPLDIRLQPWGRIEGTVRTRDGHWAGRKVSWTHPGNLTDWMTLFYDSKGFSAVSDEDGKFTLEHVPPGDGRVAVEDSSGTTSILSCFVRVNPGETTQVQIGGVGRPVIGRLVAPAGVEIRSWSDQVQSAELHTQWDDYHIPQGLTGNAVERWKLEFEDTGAGRTWFRDQYSYAFKVNADGSFAIPEVLPGKYHLFVNVGEGYLGSGQDSKPSTPGDPRIAATGIKITVPNGEDAAAVDLGEIVLNADH